VCEVGMTTGDDRRVNIDEGITYNEKITSHVLDVGANYWSVWNWHNEAARLPDPGHPAAVPRVSHL